MDAEVQQVVAFLSDDRREVREMAAEGIAGYTATDDGMSALGKCGELPAQLVSLLERVSADPTTGTAAAHAAACMVNLSMQPAERLKLIEAGAVPAAAKCVRAPSRPSDLGKYASMLLSNLTQFESAHAPLLEADAGTGVTPAAGLLRMLIRSAVDSDELAHLTLALTNVAQTRGGRSAVLEALAGKPAVTSRLCSHLSSPDPVRRVGVAQMLKNICFATAGDEPEAERAILTSPATSRPLIAHLAGRLAVRGAPYKESEEAEFHAELRAAIDAAAAATPVVEGGAQGDYGMACETLGEARLACTEALLLLSASEAVCEQMREVGLYPVLRESHLSETVAEVKEANEQLVYEFYLRNQGPAPEGMDSPFPQPGTADPSAGASAGGEGAEPPHIDDLLAGGGGRLVGPPPSAADLAKRTQRAKQHAERAAAAKAALAAHEAALAAKAGKAPPREEDEEPVAAEEPD
jgi:hypothetical protein